MRAELRRFVARLNRAAQTELEQGGGAAPTTGPSIATLEARRARATSSMARLTVQVAEGVPWDVVEEAMAELVEKRDRLDAQIAEARAKEATPAPDRGVAVSLLEDWDVLPVALRREMLARLFKVTVDFAGDRKIKVTRL